MLSNSDIEKLKITALKAGHKIMEIYNNPSLFAQTDIKSDNSPLTLADKAANEIIVSDLNLYFPSIPVFSEEGKNIAFEERKNWEYFWLVDPLDGTKEFINRNGEFTVNIALIKHNEPVFGVIYVPAQNLLYFTEDGKSYKVDANGYQTQISVNNKTSNLVAVKSKSHASEEEDKFFAKYDIVDSISVGSSLKFLMVSEGKADIYYRNGPTSEWDTAAGHAMVLNAGGKVKGLTYNKENILNGSFEVYGF
jgi:3'(2'), 5'-bisphosphate nucleotidase